jgi:phage tail sheath gpL-like
MGIDVTAVARVTGIDAQYKDLRGGALLNLPQHLGILAQGATLSTYASTKFDATSATQVGDVMGYGSPAHLIAKQLFPDNGDGVGSIPVTFHPLSDAYGSAAALGTITPSGTVTKAAAYRVRISNILSAPFTIAVSATVAQRVTQMTAAINAVLDMPVVAADNTTAVGLTAKWAGASGNDIYVEVVGDTAAGNVFVCTSMTGGSVNPDVTTALASIGGVWETMLLNAMELADTATLNLIQTWGDGRWGATVKKPVVCFTGCVIASQASAIAVSDARKTDKINSQLVSPGSHDLPFVVAARQLARIVVVANNNPPTGYAAQAATGLTPGDDSVQWDWPARDAAVKGGSSTVEVKDGVVNISDVVTFYHPTGDQNPAFRFVCDIVKIQQYVFNLALIFEAKEWAAAPLIPDDQPTTNPNARKPKSAVAEVCTLHETAGLAAIISDVAFAKKNTFASIDSQNPKRLNVNVTIKLSGNTNIVDVSLNFGFFFGTLPLAA